jgi:RimJ/RimL family protein N-acetyltransferase
MKVLETERLIVRPLTPDGDCAFIIELLNDPAFIRYIGDKSVRTLDDARNYILNGPIASYERFGFGLCAVDLKNEHIPIGMCGLLKRDTLPHPDIGFAFLPAFCRKGYAFESADAVMKNARSELGINEVLAITSPDNEASGRLLGKLGFRFEKLTRLTDDADEVKLFSSRMP